MNFEKIIVFILYLILIGIIATSLNKVLNSSTAFEEYEISNNTKLPSFTLCPSPIKNEYGVSIETFEETMIAIENAKTNYTIEMAWSRSFDKGLVVYYSIYSYNGGTCLLRLYLPVFAPTNRCLICSD